jgi:hypothetical protein
MVRPADRRCTVRLFTSIPIGIIRATNFASDLFRDPARSAFCLLSWLALCTPASSSPTIRRGVWEDALACAKAAVNWPPTVPVEDTSRVLPTPAVTRHGTGGNPTKVLINANQVYGDYGGAIGNVGLLCGILACILAHELEHVLNGPAGDVCDPSSACPRACSEMEAAAAGATAACQQAGASGTTPEEAAELCHIFCDSWCAYQKNAEAAAYACPPGPLGSGECPGGNPPFQACNDCPTCACG